jgi:cytochrome c5
MDRAAAGYGSGTNRRTEMTFYRMGAVALFSLTLAGVAAGAEPTARERGRMVYQNVCMACHAPENVMVSSPKAGDAAEWARRGSRTAQGLETLARHAMEGFGAMPPKGGRPELTLAQIRDAIDFMASPATTASENTGHQR